MTRLRSSTFNGEAIVGFLKHLLRQIPGIQHQAAPARPGRNQVNGPLTGRRLEAVA